MNSCTLLFPGDPGYFAPGGTGIATNQNVLWGDYFYVNPAANFADGNPLVHIEASATNPETSTSGKYTFYGRYDSPAFNAADNREPLVHELRRPLPQRRHVRRWYRPDRLA